MRKSVLVLIVSVWVAFLMHSALRQSEAQLREAVTSLPGAALPGLNAAQIAAFVEGLEDVKEVETIEDGLGPVFNGRSCAECHAHPVIGGASPDDDQTVVVRIARRGEEGYDAMSSLGGSVLQRRSIRELDPNCPIVGEQAPPEATFVSRRMTPPLFGLGLVEAIPDRTLLLRHDPTDRDGDGISGVVNRVLNPETKREEIGRFGWKAHGPTLHLFAGDAYLNEMGITSPAFPEENYPQGQPIVEGWDVFPEVDGRLEDDGEGVDNFVNFMRFLAPLAPVAPSARGGPGATAATVTRGAGIFQAIGCASCHVPTLMTGDNALAVLSRKPAHLYSDLLIHDMGPALADGIELGVASGSEWRTAPLWGLSRRKFLLHDGRARAIPDAIVTHGGEATGARDHYLLLSRGDRAALLAFLGSL